MPRRPKKERPRRALVIEKEKALNKSKKNKLKKTKSFENGNSTYVPEMAYPTIADYPDTDKRF